MLGSFILAQIDSWMFQCQYQFSLLLDIYGFTHILWVLCVAMVIYHETNGWHLVWFNFCLQLSNCAAVQVMVDMAKDNKAAKVCSPFSLAAFPTPLDLN